MASATRRALGALVTLLLLIGGGHSAAPAAAQADASGLSASDAITATVALGAIAPATLTLRNTGATAASPRLFEAFPATGRPFAQPRGDARVPLPIQPARVDPQLRAELAASPTGETEFLVFLADQADLSAAYAIDDWAARGAYVYQTLRDHAAATQGQLRAAVAARGLDYTPLWIINALAVRGDAADVAALAARAEVAELRGNRTASLEVAPAQTGAASCAPDAAATCWNIARVGANRVWADFGVRGEGITVASIDSGVRFYHPALVGQYRGTRDGSFDHNYNWFDVYGDSPEPVDSGSHGTHTMGTMVARGRSSTEPAVGVAPGASWITVRACGARECGESDLILAAQWLLAPTDLAGNNPRPDLRPHVISNSWTAGQDADWYAGYTAAWRAAGIYPVFAAGNTGSLRACSTVQSPGDYADVTAVGATDNADKLASFSSVGPGPDGRVKPDLTAPGSAIWSTSPDPARPYASNSGTSMATPHVAGAVALLWSANPALIGDYDATYAALTASALPMIGDSRFLAEAYEGCKPLSSPNFIYGHGRLDTYSAVARVTVDVPWLALPDQAPPQIAAGASADLTLTLDARRVPGPGTYRARVLVHDANLSSPPVVVPVTLTVPADAQHAVVSGRLVSAVDGAPVQGTVTVTGGVTVRSDAQGRYSITLAPADAPYTLIGDARDYVGRPATLQLGPGARVTQDFALDPDVPRLAADSSPRAVSLDFAEHERLPLLVGNEGSKTLTYTVSLADEPFGIWRGDEPDGPADAWIDPPADAVAIPLEDDGASEPIALGFSFPFVDAAYSQLYVSSNGVISFAPFAAGSLAFVRSCLPLSETPGAAIAALRVDLDPSQPGARVSYAAVAEGMLVSWENVPLYNDPTRRLSFQALLQPDGRVDLRYKSVPPLPAGESASYGLQYRRGEVQRLGCQTELGLSDGLAIELRPQPPASIWLQPGPLAGQVAPGSVAELSFIARWARPSPQGWPYSAVVQLSTNDPLQPRVRITVRLSSTAAPYELQFPLVLHGARRE